MRNKEEDAVVDTSPQHEGRRRPRYNGGGSSSSREERATSPSSNMWMPHGHSEGPSGVHTKPKKKQKAFDWRRAQRQRVLLKIAYNGEAYAVGLYYLNVFALWARPWSWSSFQMMESSSTNSRSKSRRSTGNLRSTVVGEGASAGAGSAAAASPAATEKLCIVLCWGISLGSCRTGRDVQHFNS